MQDATNDRRLDFFFHYIGRTIGAAQHRVGFVVADYFFRRWVELQGAAEAIRRVGKVHERGRDVRLLDRRIDLARVARADAVDEMGVVISAGFAVRAGLDVVGEPCFVGVVAVDAEKSVGTVENVANGVGLRVLGTEGCGLLRGARGFFLGWLPLATAFGECNPGGAIDLDNVADSYCRLRRVIPVP